MRQFHQAPATKAACAPPPFGRTTNISPDRYLRVTTTGTFTNADLVVAYRRGTAQDDVSY